MHLRLFAIVISFLCEVIRMGSGVMQKQSAHRETSEDCRGCLECSRDNGCVRCPERLFLFLQREGMSHHGTCLHACPAGHYGQRGKDINRCMKCRSVDCEHCFSRDFCTKCKPGFHLYKGKCLTSCPEGTLPHNTDCLEDCLLAPAAEWSEWSSCLRDGVTCGFRWGKQTRTRGGSRTPEEKAASLCPSHSETQRCRMRKKCPTDDEEGRGSHLPSLPHQWQQTVVEASRRKEDRVKKEDLEERERESDYGCSPAGMLATRRMQQQTPAESTEMPEVEMHAPRPDSSPGHLTHAGKIRQLMSAGESSSETKPLFVNVSNQRAQD